MEIEDTSADQQHEIVLTARGRQILPQDIVVIEQVVTDYWSQGRSFISRKICESLGWYQQNGRLKDRACRDMLRIMENRGLIILPPCKLEKKVSKCMKKPKSDKPSEFSKFESLHITTVDWSTTTIEMVRWGPNDKLWNTLVDNYHYKGYSVIVGRHLKYIIFSGEIPLVCMGWGEAAWHLKDRDEWIGWDVDGHRRNLHRVINNVRFLILPWVSVDNFASSALSRLLKAVKSDWEKFYSVVPVLAETFVERDRFKGTCYKASNWLNIGVTKGYRRKGYSYSNHQKPKDIYVYPLDKNVKNKLQE